MYIPLESALTSKHLSAFSRMSQLIRHTDAAINFLSPLSAIRSLRNRHGSVDVCGESSLSFLVESACRYRQVTFANVAEARLQPSESRIRLLRQCLSAVVDMSHRRLHRSCCSCPLLRHTHLVDVCGIARSRQRFASIAANPASVSVVSLPL